MQRQSFTRRSPLDTKAFRIITVFLALILSLEGYVPGRAISDPALTPPQTINIAYFYKPPNMDAASAAQNFSTMILTNGDSTYRDQLRANGFTSTIPEYFRSEAIQNPGSCTATPLNNQAAYKPGDFCFISQNHPDWFLLDSRGRRLTVTDSGNYYRMDPGNPGWREFFLSRVMESQDQAGWSALFLDNVEASLGKFFGNNPVRYPDEASYQAAVAGFLQYLNVNYSQPYGRPLFGNIIVLGSDDVWFNYLQYLDGALTERFAVNWDETSYLRPDKWEDDMELMERTQAQGKYAILVSPGYQNDLNRQNFAFASYLLISNGKVAFRYAKFSNYREAWLYDNYKVNLGSPRGSRYQVGTSWRRDFSNGYVIVDPLNLRVVISDGSNTYQTSTFSDVPSTYWAWSQIQALYDEGITGGCTNARPLLYCPENLITRSQMAIFLLKGKHGASYSPPSIGTSSGFADVNVNYWAAPWIKQLAAEGITGGCGGESYCPEHVVTRAQMAVFLLKSKHGASYTPPSVGSNTGFTDVDVDYWAAPWIKQLAAEGITGGCGNNTFCPENTITRGQMAVFLVRAFNL